MFLTFVIIELNMFVLHLFISKKTFFIFILPDNKKNNSKQAIGFIIDSKRGE